MTALAGSSYTSYTSGVASAEPAVVGVSPTDSTSRVVPGAHLAVGLVFGGIGALLVAIGGIGLPVALATVSQGSLVGPSNHGTVDAGLRLAPVFVAAGIGHLIAAAGLVAGRTWGRRAALLFSAIVVVAGVVAMLLIGAGTSRVSPSAQAAAAATALVVLAFVVLGYAIAFLAVHLRRVPA